MDNNLEYKLRLQDFFNKTMLSAAKNTEQLDGKMNKLESTMKGLKGLAATYITGSALVGFGKEVVTSLKNYEMFSASLRTLMYGDANAAKALQGQLVDLASKTPFSLVDVQEGSKQLLAYGFAAGKVTKDLKMLGNISSGVGAPLNDIIYLYGTLKTQGRAYTKDIMQFTSRGIPIIKELAKQFSVSEDKIQGLVEAGKVGFPQIEAAFKSMTSAGGQFAGMMDEQAKTIGGRLSNLADNWEQLKVNIGKSQTGILATTVNWANASIATISKVIETTNGMTEAFNKYGAKDFTFIQQKGSMLSGVFPFLESNVRKTEKEYEYYQGLAKNSSGDLVQSLGMKSALLMDRMNLNQRFIDKQVNEVDYKRKNAIISATLDTVMGNITLLKSSTEKNGGSKADLKEATLSNNAPLTDVYGKSQSISINVEKFGDVTMNVENVTEGISEIRTIWSKEMLEMLNDANLIARR